MAKRPDFSEAAIDKAVMRARAGKPRQLALLIKAASSLDHLVSAMEFEARYPFHDVFGTRDWFDYLRSFLRQVGVRREVRDHMNRRLREARNEAVLEMKKAKRGEVVP